MILISHRGNISGRNPERENTLDYINEAVDQGFSVEIDLWCYSGLLFMGHDKDHALKNLIKKDWLIKKPLLIHCKNLEALDACKGNSHLNCFFHTEDDYTISSFGWIIAHSKNKAQNNTICILPEIHGFSKESVKNCAGVCSDIISFYK